MAETNNPVKSIKVLEGMAESNNNIVESIKLPEGMKRAEETVDEAYFNDVPLIKVSELGLPKEQISVSLTEKDIGAFWRSKQRVLYIILGICAVYFLGILFQGGFFWEILKN